MAEVNSTAEQPFVLILVGLPGSGKSHFASRLEEKSARFVRINQDVLGDRPACEKLARSVLADGKIAVIDRCNFDVKQRKKWVQIANEKGVQCECIIFNHDKDECIKRCQMRIGHETVRPDDAARVVSAMAKDFRPPAPIPKSKSEKGEVQCSGGERFRRLENVSTFKKADGLADKYLGRFS